MRFFSFIFPLILILFSLAATANPFKDLPLDIQQFFLEKILTEDGQLDVPALAKLREVNLFFRNLIDNDPKYKDLFLNYSFSNGLYTFDKSLASSSLVKWALTLSVSFSQDGKYIAFGNYNIKFKHRNHQQIKIPKSTIEIWEVESGKKVRTIVIRGEAIESLSFSSENKFIFVNSPYGRVFDIKSGKEIFPFEDPPTNILSISQDWKLVARDSSPTGQLTILDTSSGKIVSKISLGSKVQHIDKQGWSVVFSPNGKHIITYFYPQIEVWDVNTGSQIASFSGKTKPVFSSDGKIGAVVRTCTRPSSVCFMSNNVPEMEQRDQILIFDVESGIKIQKILIPRFGIHPPYFISLGPDGKNIAVGYNFDTRSPQTNKFFEIQIYEVASGNVIKVLPDDNKDARYRALKSIENFVMSEGIFDKYPNKNNCNVSLAEISFSPDGVYLAASVNSTYFEKGKNLIRIFYCLN